jgi:hypothetical protein
VWIFIDRWKEFGGTVMSEDEHEISVFDGHETRTFLKTKIADIVEIVRPKPGQRGLIQLRDGTIVRGEIVRDSLEEVEFRANSITGKIARAQVYRVMLEPDFETRYLALKADIAPKEFGRRIALARWLVTNERMDLAIAELEALLTEADVEEARDMLRDINARLNLAKSIEESKRKRSQQPPEAPPKEGGTPAAPAASPASPADPAAPASAPVDIAEPAADADEAPSPVPGSRDILPKDLLTKAEANLIRVYEIDFKDPPSLRMNPEGIRQLILRYASSSLVPASTQDRNALYTRPAIDVARLMFDLRARDLYEYIEVDEDPASLAKYRTRVHNRWVIPNCATARCHGGVDAGRFFLYTGNPKDERIRFTNLMTLLTFTVNGKPMVDFDDPPNSILIQYAMPRNAARYPHPDVKGWRPVLSASTPQMLSDTLDWIASMYQPRPEYPVKYVPPRLDAPDRPVPAIDGPDR